MPESFGNLTNLTQLWLHGNQLTSLPESFGNLTNLTQLWLDGNQLISLPEFLGNLTNLTTLHLEENKLTSLPEFLGNLTNLTTLHLEENKLTSLPESLGNLTNLTSLYLNHNQLTNLPESFGNLTNLTELGLDGNLLTDLLDPSFTNFLESTPLHIYLTYHPNLEEIPRYLANRISINDVKIKRKYCGTPLKSWPAKWLLEEYNAEMRRLLIEIIGYEKICEELEAIELDNWREYTLLKIDQEVDIEPINLLKMTCPSTGYIHVLRVPPNLNSAREAIKWVNWGIDPEEFDIET